MISKCLFKANKQISIFRSNFFFLGLGEVYTWGDNDEGQLGDGTTNAIQRPRLVAALQGKKINRVACGSAHTLAWSTSKPANAGKLPTQVIFLAYCILVFNVLMFAADLSADISFLNLCISLVCFDLAWTQCSASAFPKIDFFFFPSEKDSSVSC